MELFAQGKIDAFLGFPPEPQELRARGIGHVLVEAPSIAPGRSISAACSGERRVHRQVSGGNQAVLRAILKAADLCVREPTRVARLMVDGGFAANYDYALQTMGDVPYARARVRTRGHDPLLRAAPARVGHIKSSPNAIIAEGTDWRFLDELKRELKA